MVKRVLVTGASGFIGRQALPALLRRGHEVHAIARRPLALDGVRWHAADLLDPASARRVMDAVRPTHLLHFAWYAEHGRFWTSPENRRWVEASTVLAHAFLDSGGLGMVAAGSCAEYDAGAGWCDETSTPVAPATEYGRCKLAAHERLRALCGMAGRPFGWGRIFHLYGPHEHPARFVPTVIASLLQGREAACTAGTQLRDFLHVADVADAFAALLDAGHAGPANIGSGEPVTLAEVGRRVAGLIGRPELLKLGARAMAPDDPPVLVPRIGALARELAWRPRYTLDTGLQHAIAWWRRELATTNGEPST